MVGVIFVSLRILEERNTGIALASARCFGLKGGRKRLPPGSHGIGKVEKTTQLIVQALCRALLQPEGAPAVAARQRIGLFPATAAGKLAAERCLQEGWLVPIPNASNGNKNDHWTITEKGKRYLGERVPPKQLVEDFLRALEVRNDQFAKIVDSVRGAQRGIAELCSMLRPLVAFPDSEADSKASFPASQAVMRALRDCHGANGAHEDVPLPVLFARVRGICPELTLGMFHDALRQLHESEAIWLHPWTGPLYEIPDPHFALLVGHEIVYYASPRNTEDAQANRPV